MQIENSQSPTKITIANELHPIYSSKRKSLKNNFLSFFVILLLTITFLVSSVYAFIAIGGVPQAIKIVENLKSLNKPNIDSTSQLKDTTRHYNNDTLSYFSATELSKLGILALPENFQVQDEYKNIKFVRSQKQSFADSQLELLKMFIDRIPEKLLNPGPTVIVTYRNGEIRQGTNFNTNTAAFASGTYIFFNDNSFKPEQPLADDSVDAAFNTFTHELGHVAQFNTVTSLLTPTVIDNSYNAGLSWIDLIVNSDFTKDFASISGWEQSLTSSGIIYKLNSSETAKTTSYGKSKIYEDMAETIAGAVSANFEQFSTERMDWAFKYLNQTKSELANNKFPVSTRLVPVNTTSPIYDKSKETEYKSKYAYTDKQFFTDEAVNSVERDFSFYSSELSNRGWKGKFTKTSDKNNVIRYTGDFVGKDRDMYVEIISFDQAKGYIVKPSGTIVVVISGYLKI